MALQLIFPTHYGTSPLFLAHWLILYSHNHILSTEKAPQRALCNVFPHIAVHQKALCLIFFHMQRRLQRHLNVSSRKGEPSGARHHVFSTEKAPQMACHYVFSHILAPQKALHLTFSHVVKVIGYRDTYTVCFLKSRTLWGMASCILHWKGRLDGPSCFLVHTETLE